MIKYAFERVQDNVGKSKKNPNFQWSSFLPNFCHVFLKVQTFAICTRVTYFHVEKD